MALLGRSVQHFGALKLQRQPTVLRTVLCSRLYSKKTWREQLTWSYAHGPSDVPLIGETLGQRLDRAVDSYGDKDMFVFSAQDVRKTFTEFQKEVNDFAAGLLSLGLRRGDRLGIWSPNCLEWIITQYASAVTGMILVNINPAYRICELEYAIGKVKLNALVSAERFKTQEYYEMLFHLCPELAFSKPGELHSNRLPDLKTIIMIDGEPKPGTFQFSEISRSGESQPKLLIEDLKYKIQPDDPVNIQFTSGTTGSPKGATLSHHNMLNNARFVGRRMEFHKKEARLCAPVPLFHCFGCSVAGLQTILHGTTVVYPTLTFAPEPTLKAVEDERCTAMYGTPTMFIDMLNCPQFNKYDLSSLNTGIMGASACPSEIMKQVINRMNMPQITICYGTTENSPVTFQSSMDDPIDRRVNTIGKPSDHVEVKIVDETGEILPVNTPGELCTRGYMVMLGYWDDKDKTNKCIKQDRWYHSGDIAILNEDGYAQIVGRKTDMIIRGGENIYPLEVEQFLYTFPKVEDVQVIGVPDERLGEELCAWIRLKSGYTSNTEEIRDFCQGKISHFKIPKYIMFVEEYPMTVTGKVQKYIMQQESARLLGLDHITPHM